MGNGRREFSDHLIDCLSCRQEYVALKKVQEHYFKIPEIEASPDFLDKVLLSMQDLMLAETHADLVFEEMIEREELQATRPVALFPWILVGGLLLFLGGILIVSSKNPDPVVAVHSESVEKEEASSLEVFEEPSQEEQIDQLIHEYDLSGASGEMEDVPAESFLDEEDDLVEKEGQVSFNLPRHSPETPSSSKRSPGKSSKILPPPTWKPSHFTRFLGDKKTEKNNSAKKILLLSKETEARYRYGKPRPPWFFRHIQADGSVGRGEKVSVLTNSLMVARLSKTKLNWNQFQEVKTVTKYLEKVSLEEKFSRSSYHLAVFTYHLAALVASGEDQLREKLKESCQLLLRWQNSDGGWSFFYDRTMPSNILSSVWAALALHDAASLKMGNFTRPVEKARHFFHRLTDPRQAECGFFVRGDHQEAPLSSVSATLLRLLAVKANRLPQTIKRTRDWVRRGFEAQKIKLPLAVDYDFLILSRRFMKAIGSLEEWDKAFEDLNREKTLHDRPARWGGWSELTRQLFTDLLRLKD
jgi:hypothetical protein